MRLYAVYDLVAETTIGPIQQAPTDGVAARAFTDALRSDELLSRHPSDYVLVFLAEFDASTCMLEQDRDPLVSPVLKGRDVTRAAAPELELGREQ